jgi:hypothetical protein
MQTQSLEQLTEKAKELYKSADSSGKSLLTDLFGKKIKSGNVRDLVETFDDIIKLSGVDPETMKARPDETEDELAYRHDKLISLVYNEGKVLDPENPKQYKYYPWHEVVRSDSHPSGFALSYDDYAYWHSRSIVGVRLCFFNKEDAIDAGKKFASTVYDKLKIR